MPMFCNQEGQRETPGDFYVCRNVFRSGDGKGMAVKMSGVDARLHCQLDLGRNFVVDILRRGAQLIISRPEEAIFIHHLRPMMLVGNRTPLAAPMLTDEG